jgi:DNA-directed RNA polymerase subunit RPC12/RpoP
MSETYCAECGTKFLTLLGHDKNRDYLGSVRCPNCDAVIDMDEDTFLDYVDQIRKENDHWKECEFKEYIARNGLEVLYWGVEFWGTGTMAGIGMTVDQAINNALENYDSLQDSDIKEISGSHNVGTPVLREISEELYDHIILDSSKDIQSNLGSKNNLYSTESLLKEDNHIDSIEHGGYVFGTPDPRFGWSMYSNDLDNLVAKVYRENKKLPLKVRLSIEVVTDEKFT